MGNLFVACILVEVICIEGSPVDEIRKEREEEEPEEGKRKEKRRRGRGEGDNYDVAYFSKSHS